ncbi:MAG: type II toxin-antitoxin system PemK/MazF family toxin [Bryobacteraceae bacterium]
MKLRVAEVVLIRIQLHQAQGSKIRPALVLVDAGDEDFVAAPITSQPRASEFDLVVTDWQAAGLNVPSMVRVHKLTVLAEADIVRRLGVRSSADREMLSKLLCASSARRDGRHKAWRHFSEGTSSVKIAAQPALGDYPTESYFLSTSSIRISITLVRVGPVFSRSPAASRNR